MTKSFARRLKVLEEKAGLDKEVTIVLIRNSLRYNMTCKGFKDIQLCSPFIRFKQNPRGMNKSGFTVFAPPCEDCTEAV